jgi:hypothetical protein
VAGREVVQEAVRARPVSSGSWERRNRLFISAALVDRVAAVPLPRMVDSGPLTRVIPQEPQREPQQARKRGALPVQLARLVSAVQVGMAEPLAPVRLAPATELVVAAAEGRQRPQSAAGMGPLATSLFSGSRNCHSFYNRRNLPGAEHLPYQPT